MALSRRQFLQSGAAAGVVVLSPALLGDALAKVAKAGNSPYGPLKGPDENGLMLPPDFSSREIARGLLPVPGTTYVLPVYPDGQATFKTKDGGWILVTNSESLAPIGAGASAIRFSPAGEIVDAYRILGGTNINCAGGPTPWGTWLSCEEIPDGLVWECDPAGVHDSEPRPALGAFNHEAAAVDPVAGQLYLTEDEGDGGFYRFTPERYPDLSIGILEVAEVRRGGRVRWHAIRDRAGARTGVPTRRQVERMTKFDGGEGIWYARGFCYFTTKGDKRVWAYDTRHRRLRKIFDRKRARDSSLDAVDNITVSATGELLVCEDGGNMEVGLITSDLEVSPLLRFPGPEHEVSEVCGVVFSPDGRRLYCTSQRAYPLGPAIDPLPEPAPGAIYEITGPFRRPRGGVPRDLVFGPPAGEARPRGPLNPGGDRRWPEPIPSVPRRIGRRALLRDGLEVQVKVREAAQVHVIHDSHDLARKPGKGASSDRPRTVVLDRGRARIERPGGTAIVRLRPRKRARKKIRRTRRPISTRLLIVATDAAGNERITTASVRVR